MKDYSYNKDVMIEFIEQAVSKNIVKIISFKVKDALRVVSKEVKEKNTILVPATQYDPDSNTDAGVLLDKDKLDDAPTLSEEYPYSEFFWSVFPRVLTEYRDLLCKSPHLI